MLLCYCNIQKLSHHCKKCHFKITYRYTALPLPDAPLACIHYSTKNTRAARFARVHTRIRIARLTLNGSPDVAGESNRIVREVRRYAQMFRSRFTDGRIYPIGARSSQSRGHKFEEGKVWFITGSTRYRKSQQRFGVDTNGLKPKHADFYAVVYMISKLLSCISNFMLFWACKKQRA